MVKVEILAADYEPASGLLYSIIATSCKGDWLVVRQENKQTWELPGGHIEAGETSDETAARELYEETGALDFTIRRMATYRVSDGRYQGFGRLYYAEVKELGPIPADSEIAEVKRVEVLPADLSHPEIQPVLFKWLLEQLDSRD